MITKFKLFEVKLGDQFFLHKKSNKLNKKDHPFDDAPFIREIDIEGHILKFNWNHNPKHNLHDKIKKRTDIKCICELNDIFEKTIRQIIPKELSKDGNIDVKGNYALHLPEHRFYFIVDMGKDEIITGNWVDGHGNDRPYSMYVRTIHNDSTLKSDNYLNLIEIDDSEFHL